MKTLQYVKVQHEIVQHIKRVCYMKRLLQKKKQHGNGAVWKKVQHAKDARWKKCTRIVHYSAQTDNGLSFDALINVRGSYKFRFSLKIVSIN